MDHEHMNGSSLHSRKESDSKEVDSSPRKMSGSSTSSSGSSIDMIFSKDDSKEVDSSPRKMSSSSTSSSGSSIDMIFSKDVLNNSPMSEQAGHGSLGGALLPEVSPQTPQWSMQSGSVAQSPQVHFMGRPMAYDPNRIPASIFCSKPVSPMDWSVASTESLFSIQMGNNSFSDYAALLSKSGEFSNSPFKLPPVPSPLNSDDRKSTVSVGEDIGAIEALPKEVTKEVLAVEDHVKDKLPSSEPIRNSTSASYNSDGSGTSAYSFAFPVFTGEGGKSIKSEKVNVEIENPEPKKPQLKPDETKATPCPVNFRWFHCFRFWRCCC
ncbi:suppressor protein SRP40-like [Malania oleifera]|uniref:suppressor protein SRP40-like n=1 Tax=Malania oleifera TaxID=397392 RepID=UPI0025AE1F07|nr:suppressor protein SRP40-like [Malania oleifera]